MEWTCIQSIGNISRGEGALLSADLYMVYEEDLLHQLQFSNVGGRIGCIPLNAATCADDVVLLSNSPGDLQILIGGSVTYSGQHRYIQQPQKSVVIPGLTHPSSERLSYIWKMGEKEMPTVEKSTRLGIVRGRSVEMTEKETINQNITTARRTVYSLMSAGFHGYNGFDPETSIHMFQIYILPVLLYGLEIILPSIKGLHKLELFHKQLLKRILSLPRNTRDPCVYVLSGQIDLKALAFFNNFCRQDEE